MKTIEEFWSLMNQINNPFESVNNIDYSIFRENYTPDYTVENLLHGGRVIIKLTQADNLKSNFDKQRSFKSKSKPAEYKELFIMLLVSIISEAYYYDGGSKIVGLRLVINKNQTKFEFWTNTSKTADIENFIIKVGCQIKLDYPDIDFTCVFDPFEKNGENLPYAFDQSINSAFEGRKSKNPNTSSTNEK